MTTSTEPTTTEAGLVVAAADGLRLPGRTEPLLPGIRLGSTAVDDDSIWLLTDADEVYRVTSDRDPARAATLGDGSATCLHVHRGTVFVGGDDAALWRLRDGALEPVESFRRAPTRPDWYTPWG